MWKARVLALEEVLKGSDIRCRGHFLADFSLEGEMEVRAHDFGVHFIADPSMALPIYEVIG
jgi:hypothetical protein